MHSIHGMLQMVCARMLVHISLCCVFNTLLPLSFGYAINTNSLCRYKYPYPVAAEARDAERSYPFL